jgi:hypothetical protein
MACTITTRRSFLETMAAAAAAATTAMAKAERHAMRGDNGLKDMQCVGIMRDKKTYNVRVDGCRRRSIGV